jgi:hypothetical protein
VDYNAAGQGFQDMVRDLDTRVSRVERIVSLFAAPLKKVKISWELLQAYLDKNCNEHDPHPSDDGWRRNYSYDYYHRSSGIQCQFRDFDDQAVLRMAIITVAACEGVMPMRLLERIQPGLVGAVDLLGEAGNEPGT